jgi:glycosyltransferase involved in cell wall biosynthesis
MKNKIVHIITGLNTGGAELMLFKLLSESNRVKYDSTVISLSDLGPVGEKFSNIGISVYTLKINREFPNPFILIRLLLILKKIRPDVIQTWLYHADLIGGIAGKIMGVPVVWSIRHNNLSPDVNKKKTLFVVKLLALMSSYIPAKIISCSISSKLTHSQYGYSANNIEVIPNGFDLDQFFPDKEAYKSVRIELDLKKDQIIIGLVGRFDRQKDHQNFIESAALLLSKKPEVVFVLCGAGINRKNKILLQWIMKTGKDNSFFLLGQRNDINRLTAAFDIAVSSSCGEGFSNVIGEAMSCEVPCVATDVGDSKYIIGETGIIVPPKDSQALAEALGSMLTMEGKDRRSLAKKARKRIEHNFTISGVLHQYEYLWELLGGGELGGSCE